MQSDRVLWFSVEDVDEQRQHESEQVLIFKYVRDAICHCLVICMPPLRVFVVHAYMHAYGWFQSLINSVLNQHGAE